MKKVTILVMVVAFITCSVNALAQKVINVSPGYGTLNAAITENGSATYILKAGGWYGLNAPIDNIDSAITILGESHADSSMPAIIQTGATSSGTTFEHMFFAHASLTMKNVFIVNADLNEGIGPTVFRVDKSARIVLDSITVDPVGAYFFQVAFDSSQHLSVYVTNSLIMRNSYVYNVWGGAEFACWYDTKWDTLYVENNTFVDIGFRFYERNNMNVAGEKFQWINHNTFLFAPIAFIGQLYGQDLYVTNNLLYLYNFVPLPGVWFGGNPRNKYASLVEVDTLITDTTSSGQPIYEQLPSTRRRFVEYNLNYRVQGLWDLLAWGNSKGTNSQFARFQYPAEYKDSSYSVAMYNDPVNFPYFKCNNNIDDYGAENKAHDPQFLDQKIYQLTDSAVAWAGYQARQFWGYSYPDPSTWPDFFYSKDGNVGSPKTWPRFNGAYSNPLLLTYSIEGLPLGDLNWFPAQKSIWQKHRTEIMAHILSEGESRVTAVKQENNQRPTKFTLSQNYPNPFNPTTQIGYSIARTELVTLEVYNILGQGVATLVSQIQRPGSYVVTFDASKLPSGVYIYRLKTGDYTASRKLMLLK